MFELERKARVDHRALRRQLTDLGLSPVAEVRQTDIYLEHPVRHFGETDEALRIRRTVPTTEGGTERITLTYKGPRVDSAAKTREEFETDVTDAESLHAILESLGFEPVAELRKTRVRYEYRDVSICLDTVEDLGEFLEVETTATGADLDAAQKRLEGMLAQLEISPASTTTTPYLSMFETADSDAKDRPEGGPSRSP